jgi:hypothetical protein
MLEHVVFELKFALFTPDVEILLRMITKIERIVAIVGAECGPDTNQ